MSPKIPLHISFYQLWMERLEGCCRQCAEISDDASVEYVRNDKLAQENTELNRFALDKMENSAQRDKASEYRNCQLKGDAKCSPRNFCRHTPKYHPYIFHGQLYRNKTRREPTIQFIVDTINDEEDEADYCKDLVEDLIDAYALQEKKTKQRQQIHTNNEP
ncbi:uncharacterized protein LOC130644797 [Hydractinia symbiolongicarpus]|uniref:uncharacterized protein LOC130644797 n=1 Tax=Hydractinia symbiolongicarpus TaxID=13093 RepID=UPI00254B8B5E|nr:uncharacterized protein LOC130644797 [Hydractinia symbiolongicarpus]